MGKKLNSSRSRSARQKATAHKARFDAELSPDGLSFVGGEQTLNAQSVLAAFAAGGRSVKRADSAHDGNFDTTVDKARRDPEHKSMRKDQKLRADAQAAMQSGLGVQGGRKASNKGVRVLSFEQILNLFDHAKRNKKKLELLLADLVADGKLIRLKNKHYSLPESMQQARGYLSIQRQGMGFVRLEARGSNDIYVHPTQMNGAWNGDKVLIGILPGQSGKNPEGRVLEILERGQKELAVQLLAQQVKEEGIIKQLARPMDIRSSGYILVDLSPLEQLSAPKEAPNAGREGAPKSKLREGDCLLARFVPLRDDEGRKTFAALEQARDGVARATAVEVLEAGSSVPVYERMVKASHGIAIAFPPAVLNECANLPADPNPAAVLEASSHTPKKSYRRDLRALNLVTIDGADAKDFDDAICVQKDGTAFTLWVAIADVAHYVEAGSALDTEAVARGNSCYFPASVEPMLPEALSNGLCSLKPQVPRLAMLAEIKFSNSGAVLDADFYPALIESKARLTYEEVQTALDANAPTEHISSELLDMLCAARLLAQALIGMREKRGTLAFDLPEPRAVITPEGKVGGFSFRERLFSHRLIEEFMIAANEAVARYLSAYSAAGPYFLYRTHAAPDQEKLRDMLKVLAQSGIIPEFSLDGSAKQDKQGASLQRLLAQVKGSNEEFVVNRMLLRSLMQARYSPIAEGHFGLASEAYCHFTSPIRRYADLAVHRALRHTLGFGGKVPSFAALAQIAEDLNESERNAINAEREIYRICAAMFMEGRVGENFNAYISGMNAFGVFVELKNYPVEGFVRLEALTDDYYRFVPERQMLLGLRQGRMYRMGQELELILETANPARQEIIFSLAKDGSTKSSGRLPANLRLHTEKKITTKPAPKYLKKGNKREKSAKKGSVRTSRKFVGE